MKRKAEASTSGRVTLFSSRAENWVRSFESKERYPSRVNARCAVGGLGGGNQNFNLAGNFVFMGEKLDLLQPARLL